MVSGRGWWLRIGFICIVSPVADFSRVAKFETNLALRFIIRWFGLVLTRRHIRNVRPLLAWSRRVWRRVIGPVSVIGGVIGPGSITGLVGIGWSWTRVIGSRTRSGVESSRSGYKRKRSDNLTLKSGFMSKELSMDLRICGRSMVAVSGNGNNKWVVFRIFF